MSESNTASGTGTYMCVEQVMDELHMTRRSARKVMAEIGKIKVGKSGVVKRSAFLAYLSDLTPDTFYNRPDGQRYKPAKAGAKRGAAR